MLRNTKFYVALALMVQSAAAVVATCAATCET